MSGEYGLGRSAPLFPVAKAVTWKPHVRPVVMGSDHIAVLGENASHLLKGATYVKAAPLLNGRWCEEDIYARLEGDGVLPLHAHLALAHLRSLGVITETQPPGISSGQADEAAFWVSVGGDAVVVG